MALNAWNHAGDEPTRLAHLDDRHDRAVLLQGREGPTQIVELLWHGTLHRRCFQRRWCHLATVRPIASRGQVVRIRGAAVFGQVCWRRAQTSFSAADLTEHLAPVNQTTSGPPGI